MPAEIARFERYPETVTINLSSAKRERRRESDFIFGTPDTYPDAYKRGNTAERFMWVGGCLTRYAAYAYLQDMDEAGQRLEVAYTNNAYTKPTLSDSQQRVLFDLPSLSEQQRHMDTTGSRMNLDNLPGFRPSCIAEAGHTLWGIGRRLQRFSELEGTVHSDLSDTNPDYFVDTFTRRREPATETAGKVVLTSLTSRSPETHPHYVAEMALSGNRRDVQARFSYTAELSALPDVSSPLTVEGSLTYGPEDYRFQNLTLASLVMGGMRLERMGMSI